MLKRLVSFVRLALFVRQLVRGWPHWAKSPLNLWLRRYGDYGDTPEP